MSKKLYNTFNKKEIEDLYITQRIPLSGIAHIFGVTHKTMKRFFIENNITIQGRISSNKFLSNIKWLQEKYESGMGIQKMANIAKSTRGNIYYALRKANISLRKNGDINKTTNRITIGITSGNYKGGKRKTGQNGRYYEILTREHPFANKDGYVMEHRLVVEKSIGRYLTKYEIVHHLDGNGHNNGISNLQLTTKKEHFRNHFEAVKLVKPLEDEVTRLKKLLYDNNIAFL